MPDNTAVKSVFLTGQCTLHWGRMEFGNIGNYYILEPMIRELHRVFPSASIRTTFQLSEEFCQREHVTVLPMDLFYSWSGSDLEEALQELSFARAFDRTGTLPAHSPYIDEVIKSDLVIDFSGDIWGDNANLLGPDRFAVGLCRNRTAQLMSRPVVMIAGSPGPFNDEGTREFAREVFAEFALVTNREPLSTQLLATEGFELARVQTLACPAFLFERAEAAEIRQVMKQALRPSDDRPIVGFILCGWNFDRSPFDRWPRDDEEYLSFAETIEQIEEQLGATVCLMSHSNGFPIPPEPFKLLHGRDYAVIKQLERVLRARGKCQNFVVLDGVYSPRQTKAIIGSFDMLISGRIHAAVAALSQNIPTVVLDYGHEPRAHKLKGFAAVAGVEEYVVDPGSSRLIMSTVLRCWHHRKDISAALSKRIPEVQALARTNFDAIADILVDMPGH